MEAWIFFIFMIILTVIGYPAYLLYQKYDHRYLLPVRRKKALKELAQKTAAHNVHYIMKKSLPAGEGDSENSKKQNSDPDKEVILKQGFDLSKVLQEKFGTIRKLPAYLSLAEVLDKEHPANQEIKSWFEKYEEKPFHSGPYAEELTAEEWEYVQEQYRQALENLTQAKISAQSHTKAVLEFENHAHKEIRAYVQARKEIENDPLEKDFRELEDNEN